MKWDVCPLYITSVITRKTGGVQCDILTKRPNLLAEIPLKIQMIKVCRFPRDEGI